MFNQPVTKRTLGILITAVAAVAVLGGGGRWLYRSLASRPPTTAEVRGQVWDHLAKKARKDEFKMGADWTALTNVPLAEGPVRMVAPAPIDATVTPAKSNKLAKAMAKAAKAKARKAPPAHLEVSRHFREKQQEASSYEEIYFLIGQQLWAAEQMLSLTNEVIQQGGVVLAGEAARFAQDDAQDGWLAARICEGYLWPSLDLVENAAKPLITADHLLAACDAIFRANEETPSLIRNYEYMIRKSPRRADLARYRLAVLYEQNEDYSKALRSLQEITSASEKIQDRIATMQARLQVRLRR